MDILKTLVIRRTAPKLVDPTTPGVSYELPAEPWIEWLEEYGHSAKKIE